MRPREQRLVTTLSVEAAWRALRAAARLVREAPPPVPMAFALGGDGALLPMAVAASGAALRWQPPRGWALGEDCPPALRELAPLYLDLASAGRDRALVLGHLGQSLDGFVATAMGDSCYVNGPENIVHLHRLRALSDAVLVGAGTVAADDPRLTTRLVPGDSPLRVVLDAYGRLPEGHRVFADGDAPTLLVRAEDAPAAGGARFGEAEVLRVPARDRQLDLTVLLARLRARGLHALFVEGGGTTVSGFLQAGLLDRLQVTVAPLIIGAGRPGVRLPASARLSDCLRPACRVHVMGDDVLFDCDLRAPSPSVTGRG